LRREWIEAHARTQALLSLKIVPVPAAPLAPLAKFAPLTAVPYAEVAQLNLFSKDRNPQVIIDPPAPVKEKPVPPFPVAHGVLLWEGTPPTIVLSGRPGGAQRGYHPSEQIGEWKIVSIDNQYVVLEWDGKEFKKRIDELMDKGPLVAEVPKTPAAAAAATATPAVAKSQSLSDSSKQDRFVEVGSADTKGCKPGDDTPSGTVVDGFKKVVSATPFGNACRWEQVK
jgi:hypothetical protein